MGKLSSWVQLRILVLIISTCCLTLIVANIVTLNFTIICMVHPDYLGMTEIALNHSLPEPFNSSYVDQVEGELSNGPIDILIQKREVLEGSGEDTDSPDGNQFKWSKHVQNTLFSAFAWGALLGTLPVSYLLQRFGTRRLFTVVGILSSIATGLSPLAAYQGYPYLIMCRILLGISYAAFMPTMGAITAHWAQLSENGLFMGFLGSATQLSPVVAMPISGAFCTSRYGWPAVFYVQGIVTGFFFLLWALLYRNTPRTHPFISKIELDRIESGKAVGLESAGREAIPWKSILFSVPILVIMISSLGNMIGINAVIIYTPIYLRTVLNFDIRSVSLLATLPTLFQFGVKFLGGIASDCLPWGDTLKVRLFNGVALLGMALFLAILAFIPAEAPITALSILISATAVLGFHSGGFFKSATLVSRHYSPLIMGIVQLIDCFVWLTVPFVVGGITINGTVEEWRIVWMGCAAILFLTNLVFCCYGSGEPAKWAIRSRSLTFEEKLKLSGLHLADSGLISGTGKLKSSNREYITDSALLLRKHTALLDLERLEFNFRDRTISEMGSRMDLPRSCREGRPLIKLEKQSFTTASDGNLFS